MGSIISSNTGKYTDNEIVLDPSEKDWCMEKKNYDQYDDYNSKFSDDDNSINSDSSNDVNDVNDDMKKINVEFNDNIPKSNFITEEIFQDPVFIASDDLNKKEQNNISYLHSHDGGIIKMLKVAPNNNYSTNNVIVYSHDNRDNILIAEPLMQTLANECMAIVISYDYNGYEHIGNDNENNKIISKIPSEGKARISITTVMNYVQKTYSNKNIMLMGYSFGTGVVIDYAYVKGWEHPIVLLSSYKSIQIIRKNTNLIKTGDTNLTNMINTDEESTYTNTISREFIYNNIEKISKLTCPVLFIHGMKNDIISWHHTEDLFECLNDKTLKPKYFDNESHEIIYCKQILKILKDLFISSFNSK